MSATVLAFKKTEPEIALPPVELPRLAAYFGPPGMTSRRVNLVFRAMSDEERRGYLRALDRANAAEREIEAALGEAHRILMASARRHHPKMAQRIIKAWQRHGPA